ncbi:transcriptional regulator, AraC family [Clostridium acidisoli DSM 12555]|uniref:Transcriptional regulator, AraC family n=1 Tax=Clostridium acidisoli DSM 12555 TaxID=1121291 RepID=A0A1W1XUF6_9CLOT|nr:transcriptional regulator, AraC family [Clostridium acidisoli DSM 12555]
MNEEAILKIKKGYLNENFKYFHLKDKKNMKFESHYHDFNKIIIFISGTVNYLIEGKSYKLKPWDIIFVNTNEVHRPIVSPDNQYERIIIWINKKFLNSYNTANTELLTCFKIASEKKHNLLRLDIHNINRLKILLQTLETENNNHDFGSDILRNSVLIQLMVYMNRLFLKNKIDDYEIDVEYDKHIVEIIEYIGNNLNGELSIEKISSTFYINKYYLMHKFKEQTGFTLHNYIQQKRLLYAVSLIRNGAQISTVYLECGFGDYSSFVRAFKKMFELSPKNYYKAIQNL